MTDKKGPRGVRPNGPKIKLLRERAGISQRDFAARFAITARTLQRAESGERILPEMLSSIAAGLKAASSELTLEPLSVANSAIQGETRKERVRLPRTSSAREIATALAPVQNLVFEYDIDPDENTAEDLAAAIEIIERMPERQDANALEPSAYVRHLGQLNGLLSRLEEQEIRFYTGSYWEPAVMIEEQPAPGRTGQNCWIELICRGIMLIGQKDVRYLTRPVTRKYTDEQIDAHIEELTNSGWKVEDRRISS